jgi:hypothetical protein
MKKLRLELEALQIESFSTQQTLGSTGTVRAHYTGAEWYCATMQYHGCYSGTCAGQTQACPVPGDTFGETQSECSQGCTYNTCNTCTIVH